MSLIPLKRKKEQSFWIYIIISAFAYTAVDINLQGFLALLPFVREEFFLSGTQVGLYSSIFFLSSTMMAIPGGQLVDNLGSKKGMVGGVIFVGGLLAIHSMVSSYTFILILAFFTGIGFSLVTPAVNKGVIAWSPSSKRAIAMGIMQSGGCIGGLLGAGVLPLIAANMGWRRSILISGMVGVIISFLILLFYKDRSHISLEDKPFNFKNVKYVLANKMLLLVCSLGLVFGCINSAITTHLALYLNQEIGLTKAWAGLGLGVLQLGGITGRLGWGWLSDRFFNGNRKRVLYLICLVNTILAVVFSLMINMRISLIIVFLLIFILGVTALGWLAIFFTTVGELAREDHTGTATGLSLLFIRGGVVFSPPLFGYLYDLRGSYSMSWLLLAVFVFIFASVFYWYSSKIDFNTT